MSEIIRDSKWRNKKTKHVATVIYANNQRDFPSVRSAHGDGSDDAYADLAAEQRLSASSVMYRYDKKVGKSKSTVSIKRGAFLNTFEPVKVRR